MLFLPKKEIVKCGQHQYCTKITTFEDIWKQNFASNIEVIGNE